MTAAVGATGVLMMLTKKGHVEFRANDGTLLYSSNLWVLMLFQLLAGHFRVADSRRCILTIDGEEIPRPASFDVMMP